MKNKPKIWSENNRNEWLKKTPEDRLISDVFNINYDMDKSVKKRVDKIPKQIYNLFNELYNKKEMDEVEKDIFFAFLRRYCPTRVIYLIKKDIEQPSKDEVWEKIVAKT